LYSALTGVNAGVASGPKVVPISSVIVPPIILNVFKFQRGVVALVLIESVIFKLSYF
jgi:hypothetical protein